MKQYLTFLRIKMIAGLQYRSAALAGMVTQIFWGIMYILMYQAFYKGSSYQEMSFLEIVSYVWLNQAFLSLFMFWRMDNEILESIEKGDVIYELCRPLDIYWMWLSKNAASRISQVVLRCVPLLLFSFLLPEPYRLVLPNDLSTLILFMMSMVLAFLLVLGILMIIYVLSFFTISANGIRIFLVMLIDFLSGAVIPLPYFPSWIRRIAECLPFAYIQDTAFRIYSGNIQGMQAYYRIGIQLFWVVIIIGIGHRLMKKALSNVLIQGG